MSKQIQWQANGADGTSQVVVVRTDAGENGKPLTVKAQGNVTYELKDLVKGVAPDQMLVRRKGKNLEIVLDVEGKEEEAHAPADIVVEDYFDVSGSRLVGLAEDGSYYTYVPQEGSADLLSWKLEDTAYSYHSLGYSDASAVAWWPLLGLLALGGGGGGGVAAAPTRKPPVVVITEDANNDGKISETELNGQIDVRISLPDDVKVGETLVVTDNHGNRVEVVLTQPNIDAGGVDVTFPPPGKGETIVVEAVILPTDGGSTPKGEDKAVMPPVETTEVPIDPPAPPPPAPAPAPEPPPAPEPAPAPPAPQITVSAPDHTTDTTPTITGTTDVPPGRTVTVVVTDNSGNTQTLTGTVQPDGSYSVTPTTPLVEGPYEATATVTDPAGNPAKATDPGSIDIPANVISGTGGTGVEDGTPITGTLTATDPDGLSDGSVFSVSANPTHGTASIDPVSGAWTYTPVADYNGGDSFTVTITDDEGNTTTQVINVTVDPVVDIADDSSSTTEDNPVTISVLGNDTFEGTPVVTAVGTPSNGTVVINPDNTVTYTPNANYVGTDSFTYTVTSPAGVTETATVTVSVTPQLGVVLSEEGLSGGIADALGNPTDTTDLAALTQALPMDVTAATGPSDLTSDGEPVVWSSVNTATGLVLTGQADGKDVVRVDFNNTDNTYTVELLGPLDHPIANDENLLTFNVGLTTSAGPTSLTVTVEDDAPSDDVRVQNTEMVALQDTNLMLVLDASQSMSVGTPSQLSQAVNAAKLLLDSYDAYGDVRVRLVVFDTTAKTQGTVWMTVAEAKVALDAVQLGSWTNYDAALANAISAFGSPGKLDGAQNVSYFLTDGAPSYGDGNSDALVNNATVTGDVGISATEEAIWRDFLTANNITSHALGFGGDFSAATRAQLDPIAYNGATGVDMTGIRVGSVSALADMLLNLSASSLTGNVIGAEGRDALTNEVETVALGADGGYIHSINFLGGTFTYDAATQTVSKVGGANLVHTFDPATGNLVIGQTLGSVSFAVNVFTGAYEYRGVVGNTELVKLELIDNDGDRGTVDLSLTVNYNPAAVPTVLSTVVSEEGLAGGSKDAEGIPTDATNTASTPGFLAADVTSASGPAGLTSGGQPVTWTSTPNADGLTLTGSAGGVPVMQVVFNNTNNTYSVQLLKPLDHPNTGGEDVLNFSVNATTSGGPLELKIAVEDDAPTADTRLVNTVVGDNPDANVMLVLDRSGSMGNPFGPTATVWSKLVEAANNLLDTFDANGQTKVRLVSFANTGTTHGTEWLTVAEAKAIINAMAAPSSGPGTNYDAALNVAMSAFSTTTGRLTGAKNYSYFLTDGAPSWGDGNSSVLLNQDGSGDVGIQPAEEAIWKSFLDTNKITSQALGFSASYDAAQSAQLDPIAYNGVTGTDMNGVHVPNPNNLSSVLVGMAPTPSSISGTVVGGLGVDATTGQSETVSLGADGGYVQSVGLLGGTFTYNAATDSVSKSGGASLTHSFNATTDVLTVQDAGTNQTLTINMVTGAYTYTAPTGTITKASVVLTDRDGDQGSATLTLAVATQMGDINPNTLVGTDGADVIAGRGSSDTLTGGGGADTFVWLNGDGGNLTVRDRITDFKVGTFNATTTGADAPDRLDLSNFLTGATADNLNNYLSVVQVSGNTEIRISLQGGFVNGAYNSQTDIHNGGTIVLEGVSLSGSNQDKLNQLLSSGQLLIG